MSSGYEEEQVNEMEAMEAIYQQDYARQSSRQYSIALTPNTDGSVNHVSCLLSVSYPPQYPSVAPSFTVSSITGLSAAQLSSLSSLASSVASSLVGDCSVFQVTTALRDALMDSNQPALSMFQQMEAGKRQEGEGEEAEAGEGDSDDEDEDEPQAVKDARRERRAAERRAMRGPSPLGIAGNTLVTVSSFTAWKAQFDEEQRRLREEEEKAAAASREGRLTGKQLWSLNLAKELQDEEADGLEQEDDAAARGKEASKVFWFSEGLYADDDAALPDDDGEDEQGAEGGREENRGEREEKAQDEAESQQGASSSSSQSAIAITQRTPAASPSPSPSPPPSSAAASSPSSSSASSRPASVSKPSGSKAAAAKPSAPPTAAAPKGGSGSKAAAKSKGKR